MSDEIRLWLKDNFKKTLILHHYGMTEASRSFFCPIGANDNYTKNWVGFTAQSVKYELVNIQKDKTSNRQIGEIKISGNNLASSYYKNKN